MSFFVLSPQECENNFQNAVVTHVKLWPIQRFFISRILNCNVYLPVQCLSLIRRHNLSQFLSSKSLCKNQISVSSTLLFSLTYKRKTRLQYYLCAHSTPPASWFWQKLTLPPPQIWQWVLLGLRPTSHWLTREAGAQSVEVETDRASLRPGRYSTFNQPFVRW